MSDTPRTDSLKAQYFKDSIELYDVFYEIGKLERELAEAKADRDEGYNKYGQMWAIRDKWRECARELAGALKLEHHENEGYLRGGPHALARFDELEKGEK